LTGRVLDEAHEWAKLFDEIVVREIRQG